MMEQFSQIIAAPSVSCVHAQHDQGNRAVIELLANWFESLGFSVEMMEVCKDSDKYNLIATLGSGSDGLVMSGHTDTVPYDDKRWLSDPFKLTERDQRLYGLGSADMKSFFPLVIAALQQLDLGKLRRPLSILATADEESTMAGARALVATERRLGRYAVIGEPTGMTPVRMHKGIIMEAIRLTGRSGHSSNPALGNNALEGMHKVISQLLNWRAELQERYRDPMFDVVVPTLNLGHIHGGDNPNRICADCELHIDLRLLPGMGIDEMRIGLQQQVEQALQGSGLDYEVVPLFYGTPALSTPASSAIVGLTEKLTGRSSGSVAFGTEGPYLDQLGMETVIVGPGNIDQAHQPDEYLALDRIQPAIDLYRDIIGNLCMMETSNNG
jgi:acetylornithine deacetylase